MKRFIALLLRVYPTLTEEKAERHIKTYRARKKKGGIDWEGENAFLAKAYKIAIRQRHVK